MRLRVAWKVWREVNGGKDYRETTWQRAVRRIERKIRTAARKLGGTP